MVVFGKRFSLAVCETYKNDFHKNAAYLIILCKKDDITVVDKSGHRHTGQILLIKPMVEHFVEASSTTAYHIFLAPHSSFAENLGKHLGDFGVSKLPANVLPFNAGMPNEEVFDILDKLMAESNENIDPRLAAALDDLENSPSKTTLVDVAKRCDLSPSRLRVLAKEQIGISLSTLHVWRKAVKSMQMLSSGCTLSEAAQAGGFSDQAHFNRTVRKMFGITPSGSTRALDCQK